jgi:hypothetical protein
MKTTDLERDTVLQYGWNWPTFRHGDTSKITASFVMPAETSNLTQDEKFSTGEYKAAVAMAIQNSNACYKENETPSYKSSFRRNVGT